MIAVPKSEAIVKGLRIVVGELELPLLASIRGLVNPGLFAGADAERVRSFIVKAANVTEIELVCALDPELLPMLAAINGAQEGSVGSAGPRYQTGNSADAPKLDVRAAVLLLPLPKSSLYKAEKHDEKNEGRRDVSLPHSEES